MNRIKILLLLAAVLIADALVTPQIALGNISRAPVAIASTAEETKYLAVQIDYNYRPDAVSAQQVENNYTPKTPGARTYGYKYGYLGFPDAGDVSDPKQFAQKANLQWWLNRVAWETRNIPIARWAFQEVQARRKGITFEAYCYGHAQDSVNQIGKGLGTGFTEYVLQTGDYFYNTTAGGGPGSYTQAREWYNTPGYPAVKAWNLSSRAYGTTLNHLVIQGCGNAVLFGLHLWVVYVPVQPAAPPTAPPTSPASGPQEVADFQVAGASMPGTKTTYVPAQMPAPNIFIPLPTMPKPVATPHTGMSVHLGGGTFTAQMSASQAASQAGTIAAALIAQGVPANVANSIAAQIAQSIAQNINSQVSGSLPGFDLKIFDGQATQG